MILIVDDDENLAENCSDYLESCGNSVSIALNGEDALSKIKAQPPELLISDCCMPDLTGLELSERLKTRSGGPHFPILLMSGSLQCKVAPGKCYDGFIKKPFLAESLLSEVEKLLQGNFAPRQESAWREK
jgi:two-component system chemotaxis response regulator CheY